MMNVRKTLVLSSVLALTAVSAVQAAPGTNKARGVYNSGGWESGGTSRSRSSHSYRAPVVQSAPAPMVAQAPEEGRRFSYAPSGSVVTGSPCPTVQGPAPAVDSGRRYSYAPEAESTVAPSVSSPRTYYSRPSYSAGGRSGGNVDRWALPKTDPRKYNSR